MRKLTLILMMLFCTTIVFAQKGKVNQASSYLNAGKLADAKTAIDEAITHEKAIDDPKSYFVKGQIYQSIFESSIPTIMELAPNALDVAYEAYRKVLELDEKNKFKKQLVNQYNNLIIDYSNQAVEYYNNQEYLSALKYFEVVLEMENSPVMSDNRVIDTMIIFNAAIAATNGGSLEKAEKYLKECIKYDYEPARSYAMLASTLKQQGKEEEALKYLHEGYQKYPSDSYMLVELINYYLMGDNPEEAEKYLDAAIEQDPTNSSFYSAKGVLFEKTEEFDKAIATYQKALEVDPNNFAAAFNLAAIYLNRVIDLHNKVNDIMDADEYNKGMKDVYEGYETAIPFFEQVYKINPKDKNTLLALKELYFKLRNEKPEYLQKYEKISAELEE